MSAKEPIPMLDVPAQNGPLLPAILEAMERVARHGQFILGPEVSSFEAALCERLRFPHAIGVSSGTDAILVGLMALGVGAGDEVVTTPYSFFATAGCISRLGARPVFADIDPRTFNVDPAALESAITPRTRAILPVHLFGQPAEMEAILAIAEARSLPILEDAAQALGASTARGPVGTLGALGAFSFFPSKNLGGFGDGGLVTTTDPELAERVRVLRAHGAKPKYHHARIGGNFRLDALQAAILAAKLPSLDGWAAQRRQNADRYDRRFAEAALEERLLTPLRRSEGHVYNQYVIRTDRRDALQAHLRAEGIATAIYYPVPLHLQGCYAELGYREGSFPEAERAAQQSLALPIFPELGDARLDRIAETVIDFLRA